MYRSCTDDRCANCAYFNDEDGFVGRCDVWKEPTCGNMTCAVYESKWEE